MPGWAGCGGGEDALCDCRLVFKGSLLALLSAEREERMDMARAAEEWKRSWRKEEMVASGGGLKRAEAGVRRGEMKRAGKCRRRAH